MAGVGALAVLALVLLPNIALADDPDDEPEDQPYGDAWRLDEIYFVPPDPVPGRRVFIEGLAVTANHANVTLRAAHELHLRGRAYGGRSGKDPAHGVQHCHERRAVQELQHEPGRTRTPSFTFSWVDALGRSGAVSLKKQPDSLPAAVRRWGVVRPGK